MSEHGKVSINRLPTGVPGLDPVLGGGIPEYSFNLIAGAPGSGKTTLAQQMMFAHASPERPAVFFTVLGEPPLKMLRYQQQFAFFDSEKVDSMVRFVNLSDEAMQEDLGAVLDRIVQEVESTSPGIVVVDSFRSVDRMATASLNNRMQIQSFVQRLAIHLTNWQATTFLVGEYIEGASHENPVFTVADGLLWLTQSVERNSVVRKLQVMKIRGQASIPGLHTFRISDQGVQVFPRTFGLTPKHPAERSLKRISTGISGLDEMLGGGFPAGDSALIAGPTGSGKTAVCTQFISEGIRQGEPGVMVLFEAYPTEYVARAENLGLKMKEMVQQEMLKVIYLRPLDLSVDETLHEVLDTVAKVGAKRVVIDSLAGFELALAPAFRQDFRESLYRMLGALTGRGTSVLNSAEVTDSYDELRFSPHQVSFLTDDIILMRYVEIDGQLRRVIMVIKTRRGEHSPDLRLYEMTSKGIVVGARLQGYRGIITGVPECHGVGARPGLILSEEAVLQTLITLGEASIADLAERTGLRRGPLRRFLDRLVSLNYAQSLDQKRTIYRPAPRLGT